ncbi:hypothetical protein [Mucilaginibacter pedocola]|uniref:YtxH domain-containing protein n=1 Tax=Mucilaginibacter pedocola TaxID=1792845 RepID=A0A1S9PGU1_9SPHI|nr:hypothetical protein [Mucilaginibacter pedocola]OOQ59778.1 hypothetical protein BC343_06395 [Mucilaginibacter pedocola]
MKNPFVKKDNSVIIGASVAGVAVAGGLAWLFFTDSGANVLDGWKTSLKEKGKDLAANFISRKTGVSKDITKPAADAIVS